MFNATNESIVSSNNTTGDDTPLAILTPYDIFIIVIGLLAVLLNGLLLIAMLRNASTIFTSNGAYLVANVAIADLLTGLNSSLWGVKSSFHISITVTKILFSFFWTCIAASFLTIFVMSLERYVAIVYPFKADMWLSKRRTIQSCLVVWFISAFCGVFLAFYTEIVTFCLMIFFEITILVTTFLYYKIFIKLGQRRACLPSQPNVGRVLNMELQREYRLTTVVVVLTFILIITVLPYMIGGQIALAEIVFSSAHYPNLAIFLHYYLPVEIMNFVLNPIVYAWRLPKYRYALLRILRFR